MRDPYQILGVQRSDDEAAIRAAYRKLAKRHHPDVNPGKPDALERFKEISTAYDLLSDKDKRARFDRGEIDAEGHEVPPSARSTAISSKARGSSATRPTAASRRRTSRRFSPRRSTRPAAWAAKVADVMERALPPGVAMCNTV